MSKTRILTSALLLSLAAYVCADAARTPLRALIVGGGPDKKHNQVAIESNVRYVARLLPGGTPYRVLFGDGTWDNESVQCMYDSSKSDAGNIYYRKPQLPRLDGPLLKVNVQSEIASLNNSLVRDPSTPVLLYFTGHGSPEGNGRFNNNKFDLWSDQAFQVKDLATELKRFPDKTPITLVMVECFSGAFANCLFEDGDAEGLLSGKQVCGFFASVPQRVAAGCTPAVNEEDYKDFTGYFFAALTGVDRMGRPVKDVDYNRDGRVGMDEAYAYALGHDDSIDTPTCTSDSFLRHYVKTPDEQVFKTRWDDVEAWATPAQKAALDALSSQLNYDRDDRVQTAYANFLKCNFMSYDSPTVRLIRFVRLVKSIVLAHSLEDVADPTVQTRFAALLKAESANPLKP